MIAAICHAQQYELPLHNGEIIVHTGWSADYSAEHELALRVAYHLTEEELDHDRINDYRIDAASHDIHKSPAVVTCGFRVRRL